MAAKKVDNATQLPPGELMRLEVGEVPVCLVHAEDGNFYAVRDECSHEQTPLSEGWVYGTQIECARHNAVFSLVTGAAESLPAVDPVEVFPVRIEGGDVYVEVNVEDER